MPVRLVLMTFLVAAGPLFGQAKQPTIDELLKTARFVTALQHQDLTGTIRRGQTEFPIGLFLRGNNIQFTYHQPRTKAEMHFHLRLEEDRFDLLEIVNGKTRAFPANKIGQSIEGMDLTYEDLSMRFLYWPKGQLMGKEKVKGETCWKIWLENPEQSGRYGFVYVWVHEKSGSLMRVVGYDRKRRPLKQFQVNDIMKVGNVWTLREMKVSSIDPAKNKTLSITYLTFDRPKKAVPRGLR